MLFDTHVHFDALNADADELKSVLARAEEAGVRRMLAVGGNAEGNRFAADFAALHSSVIHFSAGYDRDQATENQSMSALTELLERPQCVAVGEIGLDYHYHPDTAPAQRELFARMLQLARDRVLPVIVHSREAREDSLTLLAEHARLWKGAPDSLGVLHCFTEDRPFAKEVLDLGLMISFSGIVTFRNADPLRSVAREVPEERLLIETDSPFLAPVPHRGKRNEPAFVGKVAEMLANIRNDTPAHIANITARNACRLFRIEEVDLP